MLNPWLAALAPAALVVAGLWPNANAQPRRTAQLAVYAGLAGLATALGFAIAIALGGRLTTPTLGASGLGLSVYLDALSVTMFCLVSFVGLIVHSALLQRSCLTKTPASRSSQERPA